MRVLCVVLFLAVSCKPADPQDPKTWEKQLTDSDAHARLQAIQELRKLRAKEAAPQIAGLLTDPLCKEEAALSLQDLGGPAEVAPLQAAIDTTVGAGSDQAARIANRTNGKIADALGAIGPAAQSAAPALLRLARASDPLVRVSATQALGKVKAKEAVPELARMIDDPSTPELIVKKAIVSLGQIGDPAAIPALEHGLVMERRGISFLPESSFALFEIGAPSVQPLLDLMNDANAPYLAWAKENDRAVAGTYAKAALVLGDLQDARATTALLAKLKYSDPDPNPDTAKLLTELVREFSANALGKIRAKEAAGPINALITPKDEGALADFASEALVWIGDRSQVKDLLKKAAAAGPHEKRQLAQAIAFLAESAQAKDLTAIVDKSMKSTTCGKDLASLGEESPKACEVLLQPVVDAATALAVTCDIGACWVLKLQDPRPLVRARAAYELGRAQSGEAVQSLAKACKDEDLTARAAAIRALDWVSTTKSATKASVQAAAVTLAAQLAEEESKQRYSKVNEDLKRVQFKLAHL